MAFSEGAPVCSFSYFCSGFVLFLIFFLNLSKHLADCLQFFNLLLFAFSLMTHVLFIPVLYRKGTTLSWFLVFLGKKLLRIWKSVPYFLSIRWKSYTSSWVHSLDFYLDSIEWLLEMESVSLTLKVDLDLGFFWRKPTATSNSMASIRLIRVVFSRGGCYTFLFSASCDSDSIVIKYKHGRVGTNYTAYFFYNLEKTPFPHPNSFVMLFWM